jgi:hypothetical protein
MPFERTVYYIQIVLDSQRTYMHSWNLIIQSPFFGILNIFKGIKYKLLKILFNVKHSIYYCKTKIQNN